jgi:hypothetical protein
MEPGNQSGRDPKHQPVNDQQEYPQGQQGDGEGQYDQDRPEKGVRDTQDKSRHQGCHETVSFYDLGEKVRYDQDGNHGDYHVNHEQHRRPPFSHCAGNPFRPKSIGLASTNPLLLLSCPFNEVPHRQT